MGKNKNKKKNRDKHKNKNHFKSQKSYKNPRDKIKERFLNLAKLKIKSLSHRPDIAIIHISRLITELDDTINTLAGRLYDWVSVYNPKNLDRRNILDYLSKNSIAINDEFGKKGINILFTEIQKLTSIRDEYKKMLEQSMSKTAPNLTTLAGADLGAKLIAHAGSLEKLALLPASTIQVMGAEKALFKHLKNKHVKPPKHGLIFQHPYISGIAKRLRGKMARALANELAIAVRADAFTHRDISEILITRLKKVQTRILKSADKPKSKQKTKSKTINKLD